MIGQEENRGGTESGESKGQDARGQREVIGVAEHETKERGRRS